MGNSDGVRQLKLKAGAGKARIQSKARGENLSLPFPITGATGVTLQLVQDSSSGSACWSTAFLTPATKHDPLTLKFKDKLP